MAILKLVRLKLQSGGLGVGAWALNGDRVIEIIYINGGLTGLLNHKSEMQGWGGGGV